MKEKKLFIIQSSNKPIICVSIDDLSESEIRATISQNGKIVKTWESDDMNFYDNSGRHFIELPLTQQETAALKRGSAIIGVKWFNADDYVEFSKEEIIEVISREDRAKLEEDS